MVNYYIQKNVSISRRELFSREAGRLHAELGALDIKKYNLQSRTYLAAQAHAP